MHLSDSFIKSSFSSIGIELGADDNRVRSSVLNLKRGEESRLS